MRLFLLLLTALIIFACDDETADPVDLAADQNYFPLELNRSLIYDQDSIVVRRSTTRFTQYDTARAQVRETLVEQFTAGDGQQEYRGERWQRADESSPWRFVQTYTVTRSATAARRNEDNLTFTKLVFPIRAGRNWDGNKAFDETIELLVGGQFLDVYNFWNYRYGPGPIDTTYNGIPVTDVWTVEQADVDNSIEFRQAYERYAPGIGLVERFLDARHTQAVRCCNRDFAIANDLSWDEKAEKGFILHQRLREIR
ncbi:hypothetical protein [Neolewinella antarctica]|uniref:Lipoprotein n=1 Tax=Neolewinella antarctica TaxID=442734 RepID=A0ABX0X739_9BACT|nr:hypothetical protein [Neolewinella antarctica]NJC25028.1 hypothetical protein [Neolewinella antarctica]